MTHYGVYVDIFPLDYVPDNEKERRKYMHKVMSIHNRIYHRQRKDLISIIKSWRHSLDWWMNRMNSGKLSSDIMHILWPHMARIQDNQNKNVKGD